MGELFDLDQNFQKCPKNLREDKAKSISSNVFSAFKSSSKHVKVVFEKWKNSQSCF